MHNYTAASFAEPLKTHDPGEYENIIFNCYMDTLIERYLNKEGDKELMLKIKAETASGNYDAALMHLAQSFATNNRIEDLTKIDISCSDYLIKSVVFSQIKKQASERLDETVFGDSYKIYISLNESVRDAILREPEKFPMAPEIFNWGPAMYLTYGKKVLLAGILSKMDYFEQNLQLMKRKIQWKIIQVLTGTLKNKTSEIEAKQINDLNIFNKIKFDLEDIKRKFYIYIEIKNKEKENPFIAKVSAKETSIFKEGLNWLDKTRGKIKDLFIFSEERNKTCKEIDNLISELNDVLQWEEEKLNKSHTLENLSVRAKKKDDYFYEIEMKGLYLEINIKNSYGYLKRREKIYPIKQDNFISMVDKVSLTPNQLILVYVIGDKLFYQIVYPTRTFKKEVLAGGVSSIKENNVSIRKIGQRIEINWEADGKQGKFYPKYGDIK